MRMTADQIAAEIHLPDEFARVPEHVLRAIKLEVVHEILAEEAEEQEGRQFTLVEIAAELAREEGAAKPLSVERVRQIETKAMEKCRRHANRIRLRPAEMFFEPDAPHPSAHRVFR